MRGILSHSSRLLRINGITPAHAGNTIGSYLSQYLAKDHPRTRGEYRQDVLYRVGYRGITPAHAGNTISPNCATGLYWDHPRTRGEYRLALTLLAIIWGSPPHTRGILACRYIDLRYGGITPAHAGNTHFPGKGLSPVRDHPRTRGEYLLHIVLCDHSVGSPPHTRGIRCSEPRRYFW